MSDTANKTQISQIGTVFVPVADQERALGFYVEKLGFEQRAGFSYGGGNRWIEVAPSGSAIAIALVPLAEGEPVVGDQTYCALASEDIEADHAVLHRRGVDVDEQIARKGTSRSGLISLEARVEDPVPAQFFFRDIDGNRFLIVEAG
jgi:catechol 2,3-dioxygenase-like lactoylglutathione lyase family enzyme